MSHLFIGIIAPATILLPIAAFYGWIARQQSCVRYIFYYLVSSATINWLAIYLSYRGSNNLPLLHLLTVIELLFLSFFFACLFEKKYGRRIRWLGAISILFCLFNSLFWQSIFSFNSYARGLEAVVLILLSLDFFLRMTAGNRPVGIAYIVSGLLIYYAGTFFLFLFSNYLEPGNTWSTIIWNINASLVIVLYILLTIGIIKCRKRPTISTSSC